MLKKIFIGFAALIVVILIGGLFLPKSFNIEREIVVNKPKDAVFTYLKSLKNSDDWNPWMKLDPKIEKEFKGTDSAVGAVYAWKGNAEVGVGEQEIKNIIEGERVDFELRFKEPFADTSHAYLVTEAAGENQTKVKWGMGGNNKYPFNIVCFALGMQKQMIKSFDEGLASMKSHLEK